MQNLVVMDPFCTSRTRVGVSNTKLLLGWEAEDEAIRFSFALQTICFFLILGKERTYVRGEGWQQYL